MAQRALRRQTSHEMYHEMYAEPLLQGVREAELVEESLARRRTTQARYTIQAADFALELVIVGKFLVCR